MATPDLQMLGREAESAWFTMKLKMYGILADAVRDMRSAGAALEDIAATLRFAADELRSDSVR